MYAKTPTVFQMEMTECAAASLCMILSFYGRHVPLERMRVESGVSRDGCNLKGVKRAALAFGLEAHGFRRNVQALERTEVPCIIHWNGNHFVVFEGFKGKYAYINDPAIGRRRLTAQELSAGYSGAVMTFHPTDHFQRSGKSETAFSFVRPRLRGFHGVLLQILLSGMLAALSALAAPLALRAFIDGFLLSGEAAPPAVLAWILCVCFFIHTALVCYRERLTEKLKIRMTLYSVRDFLHHMLRLPVSFFDQRYTGDLVSRVTANEQICRFLSRDLTANLIRLFALFAHLAAMLVLSPALTAVPLIKTAVCALAVPLGRESIQDASARLQMSRGKISGAVAAGLNITDSIKACGMEREYAARIMSDRAESAEYEQILDRRRRIRGAIQESARRLSDLLLLFCSGYLTAAGRVTPGTFAAFFLLHQSFCASADEFIRFFGRLQQSASGFRRIGDIENHEICALLKPRADHSSAAGRLQGHIELRDISFGYSKIHPPMIDMFDLSVASGESVAIVGASGCGKSTITGLISGLYSPWKGDILFDGKPMREIPSAVIHNSVATVSQEIHLFSGSIRENLTMWDPTILQEDIEAAAKDACIEDFILSCPGGYEYRLKEHAQNISGGQRQRLEIARALAKNPSVLLLDEATSALDPLVEKQIMDNIRRRGCTCLIAAHRLSAIRDCSRIVVMDGGALIEEGTHDSLIREGGLYAALMRAQ